tara:strand:- start:697 stop:861 length:165 start_codon:yes stop_codon:yes gene_type:complete
LKLSNPKPVCVVRLNIIIFSVGSRKNKRQRDKAGNKNGHGLIIFEEALILVTNL